jgi:hypothetical protein
LFFVPVFFAVFLAGPAAASSVEEDLFARYFSERIKAETVLPVLSATEDELRRGAVPTLTVCLERAENGGVVYDRLLLVLSDVFSPVRETEYGSFRTGTAASRGLS